MQIAFTVTLTDLVRFNVHHASRRVVTWVLIAGLVLLFVRTVPSDSSLTERVFVIVLFKIGDDANYEFIYFQF